MFVRDGIALARMNNVLTSLKECTGLTESRLGVALARRAGLAPFSARRIHAWRDGSDAMPGSVERECVYWLVEIWAVERANCGASRLWEVDCKFTRMLDQFTIAELMALLRDRAPLRRPTN